MKFKKIEKKRELSKNKKKYGSVIDKKKTIKKYRLLENIKNKKKYGLIFDTIIHYKYFLKKILQFRIIRKNPVKNVSNQYYHMNSLFNIIKVLFKTLVYEKKFRRDVFMVNAYQRFEDYRFINWKVTIFKQDKIFECM